MATEQEIRKSAQILQEELSSRGDWYDALVASIKSALREHKEPPTLKPYKSKMEIDKRLTDVATAVADRIIGTDICFDEEKKYCRTCRWFEAPEEVCCNGYSKYRADFRLLEDTCDAWEGTKNG